MKARVILIFTLFLAIPAASALAADQGAASIPGAFVIAKKPAGPPPSGASPQATHQLNCNVRQTNCANICNTRYYGDARNACYNRCNVEYIRCTQKTNRLPAN